MTRRPPGSTRTDTRLSYTTLFRSEEAVAAAADLGGPAVLKVVSPTATHKSDVGGFVLGVEGAAAVADAYRRVTSSVADAEGALVQRYVPGDRKSKRLNSSH